MSHRSLVFLLMLWLPLSGSVISAEATDGEITRITIIAERRPQADTDIAHSTDRIDSDTLRDTSHSHAQQVLNRMAGVHFHRNDGMEYLPAIRSPVLSGPGACGSFLLMEDGIPLRPAGFCNVNELFESHHEQASSIELLRGPATAFYGGNALHGALNVVAPVAINSGNRSRVLFSDHDYGQWRLIASNDNIDIALTLAHEGPVRDAAGYDQQKLSTRTRHQWLDADVISALTITHLQQETAGYLVGDQAYKDKNRLRDNPNPEAFRNAESARLWQHYQWQNGLRISPYFRYSQMRFLQHFLPGQPFEENGHYSIGLQAQQVLWQNAQHEIFLGADLEHASMYLREWQDTPTIGSPFLQATIPVGRHYDYQVQMNTLALFTQYQWQISEPWLLTAGLRAEQNRYDYDNRMIDGRVDENGNVCGFGGCRFNRPADRDDRFTQLAPKFGLIYRFDELHAFSATWGEGFRPPQTTELYRLQREQEVAELDSERLRGGDLSLFGQFKLPTARLDYRISAYHYDKANAILRDTQFFNVADGETQHQGVELSMTWRLDERWRIEFAGDWSRHRYRNNPQLSDQDIVGNRIDSAPARTAFMAFGHQSEPFGAHELSLRYDSGYYLDAENEQRYPGHTVIDWRWRYPLFNQVDLLLQVLNLADRRYAERADYSAFDGQRYFPGQPRRIYFGASWSF